MKVRPAALALLLIATAPVRADDPLLSPSAFRDQIAAAFKARGITDVTAIDERSLRLKTPDGNEFTVHIDNAYADYRADPKRLDSVIGRFASVLDLTKGEPEEPPEALVILVRPSDYLKRSLAPGASTKNLLAPRPMAGDLSYFLAVDNDQSVRMAGPGDLARWKISEQEAWERANANLKQRLGPLELIRLRDEDGPSGMTAASGLAPSLLAHPDFCSARNPTGVDGQYVLVYARDFFLFASPQDPPGMQRFWKAAKQATAEGNSLSATPLTCRNGQWVAVAIP